MKIKPCVYVTMAFISFVCFYISVGAMDSQYFGQATFTSFFFLGLFTLFVWLAGGFKNYYGEEK